MPALTPDGSLILTARIRNPARPDFPGVWVRLRVDTGDTVALLDPSILRSIQATPTGRTATVQGIAGAPIHAPSYRVDLDLRDGGTLRQVEVLAWPIPDPAAQGLFGDNLLQHGVLTIVGPTGTGSFRVVTP